MTDHSAESPAATSAEARLLSELLAALNERGQQNRQQPQQQADDQEITIDVIELLYYYLSKWYYVVLGALLAAVLAGLLVFYQAPVYTATAKLYIMGNSSSSIMADLQVGSALAMDYQEVFKTWEVHEMVNKQLGTNYSYSDLQELMTVTNPNSTHLLYITVESGDPQEAADIANAYALAAQQFIAKMMDTDEPSQFSSALVPSVPSGPGLLRTVLIAMLAGTALVLLILGLRFVLDNRPKSSEDIQRWAGVPMLAVIPAMSRERRRNKRVDHSGTGAEFRNMNFGAQSTGQTADGLAELREMVEK